MNPKRTLNKLKGVFKPLKLYFRIGINNHYPIIGSPKLIQIKCSDVSWKDKYDTPRYEQCPPYVWIHLFGLDLIWFWSLPPHQEHLIDQYWEQALWYLYYYDNVSYKAASASGPQNGPNIEKARKSWPWVNAITGESTWNNSFIYD